MIVMKKDKSLSAPVSKEKAEELFADGWEVYINKTGQKIGVVTKVKETIKKEVKKKEVKKDTKKK